MTEKYYASVVLFGKNENDKTKFEVNFGPGEEVSSAFFLYEEVSRMLNFYGISENSKFFGRINFYSEFGDFTDAFRSINLTKDFFYKTVDNFINKSVIPLINGRLLELKKPLILPYYLANQTVDEKLILDSFQYLQEIYSFSFNLGGGDVKDSWFPPFDFYVEKFGFTLNLAFDFWANQLSFALDYMAISSSHLNTRENREYIQYFVSSLKEISSRLKSSNERNDIIIASEQQRVISETHEYIEKLNAKVSPELKSLLSWEKFEIL